MDFDKEGREIPDPRPLEFAPGAVRPESIQSMMRRLIRETMSAQAQADGEESFEEANDYDIDEEEDPLTQYEEMGLERYNAGESEEGVSSGGDNGSVSASGLRPGPVAGADGVGGPEKGSLDNASGQRAAAPLPAQGGEGTPAPTPDRPAVHGRASSP